LARGRGESAKKPEEMRTTRYPDKRLLSIDIMRPAGRSVCVCVLYTDKRGPPRAAAGARRAARRDGVAASRAKL
jgi:hypothetical protein